MAYLQGRSQRCDHRIVLEPSYRGDQGSADNVSARINVELSVAVGTAGGCIVRSVRAAFSQGADMMHFKIGLSTGTQEGSGFAANLAVPCGLIKHPCHDVRIADES